MVKDMKILVVNGPTLNLLGKREPDIYGNQTYEDLCEYIKKCAKHLKIEVDVVQFNNEGKLIGVIQDAVDDEYDGIVANLGAYTHYSYALHDVIKGQTLPCVEVHMSNIHAREEFRAKSVTASAGIGIISGFGFLSYELGLRAIVNKK